ncbi:hypothetical protein I553_2416 [Mycobacterium xenopi 4042]|uniref:Uncharacterized protein n=1 Tax=Mycobacterium xenopi 4042 TaxID=1299334 RepID=X8CA94_MYCXE|nr:hypothetical protein I553_2416 [Mycobacterium xenopi 4042]
METDAKACVAESSLADFFAAVEIGSVADRNALHTFTASMAPLVE